MGNRFDRELVSSGKAPLVIVPLPGADDLLTLCLPLWAQAGSSKAGVSLAAPAVGGAMTAEPESELISGLPQRSLRPGDNAMATSPATRMIGTIDTVAPEPDPSEQHESNQHVAWLAMASRAGADDPYRSLLILRFALVNLLGLRIIRIAIRVVFHRQLTIGLFQLDLVGAAGHPQDVIVVTLGHRSASPHHA